MIKNTWKAISADSLRQRKSRKLRWEKQKGDIWGRKMVPNFALETWTQKRMRLDMSIETYLKGMRRWDGVPITVKVAGCEEKEQVKLLGEEERPNT